MIKETSVTEEREQVFKTFTSKNGQTE